MRRSGNWKVTLLRGVADPVGKPQTRLINNLFRRKEAIKGMVLKTFRHVFSNKLENDIKCCINVWWRRERKTVLSKGLGWNWNITSHVYFPTHMHLEIQDWQCVKCGVLGAVPFSTQICYQNLRQLNINNMQKQLGRKLPVFNIHLYELDHGLEI